MIETKFYVAESMPTEGQSASDFAQASEARRERFSEYLAEVFGGVTVLMGVGREWLGKEAGPEEDMLVFVVVHDGLAAETLARSAADTLLDIYDDQAAVLMTQAMVSSTLIKRPHVNGSTLDVSRVVRPSQTGGNR